MGFKVKIKKVGKGFDNMKKHNKKLSQHKVEAGFFEEMGVHPSDRNTENWTYAQLMAFHELQVNSYEKRPIFEEASKILSKTLAEQIEHTFVNDLKRSVKNGSLRFIPTLDKGGYIMKNSIDYLFGKTPPLAPNRASTIQKKGSAKPMIETGSLRDGLRYKNTKDKELKR